MGRLAFCEIELSYLYIQGHSLVFVHNKTKETPSRLVVIFQETARNHFWEAGMLMQSYMLETFQ